MVMAVVTCLYSCRDNSPVGPSTTSQSSGVVDIKGLHSTGDHVLTALLPDTATALITAANGGSITLPQANVGMLNGKLTAASATIYFAPGTVSQDVYITMQLSEPQSTTFAFTFSPSGLVFNGPAVLSFSATNADVKDILEGGPPVFYCADNGQNEPYSSASWNISNGILSLSGGQVPHFSVYAFGR